MGPTCGAPKQPASVHMKILPETVTCPDPRARRIGMLLLERIRK